VGPLRLISGAGVELHQAIHLEALLVHLASESDAHIGLQTLLDRHVELLGRRGGIIKAALPTLLIVSTPLNAL
jgi:hypothetical protein